MFFLSKHYTNSQIGIVLAIASIFSVLVQPLAATFADSSARFSMKQLMIMLITVGGTLAASRFFFSNSPLVPAVLFVLEQACVNALLPLMNSLGVQVMNCGAEINFGLSRGIGSVTYAVVSFALGLFLKIAKCDVLPLFSLAFYLALAVAVVKFPMDRKAQPKGEAALLDGVCPRRNSGRAPAGVGSLLKGNRLFFLLLGAVVLAFCSQAMIGSYLIQIMKRVGGSAENVGISNGLAAAIEFPAMALFGVMIRKFRSGTLLRISFAAFVLKALAIMLAPSVGALYATQILQFGAYATFIPASVYYANEVIPEKDLAKGQAALTSASTFGGVAANLLGGWLLDCSGVGTMLAVSVSIAAVGCVIGAFAVEKKETGKVS